MIVKLIATANGSENDYLRMLPSVTTRSKSGAELLNSFSTSIAEALALPVEGIPDGVLAIPLEKLADLSPKGQPDTIPKVLSFIAIIPARKMRSH